ncbi:MAG TPA: hypothetical protein VKA69_10925 [Desulfobacteria bacterium]|nr:hypothetical protein [Desulfobacteria bacterium]
MPHIYGKQFHFFALVFLFWLAIPSSGSLQAMETMDCLGTISLQLSRSLELNLEPVAESIKALADEYARIYEATPPMDEAEKALWMKHTLEKGKTISFRPFSKGVEPAYQAPVPAYLFYNGHHITPSVTRALKTFVSLAPLFKATYRTFHYSWVYMTTVDEAFLIYPYLPLDEAVNNLPPTKQGFYEAADFEGRRFGWQKPYLDLAGAGMMVTVSYPVYNHDKLLGVICRDITLIEFSTKLLRPVAGQSENLHTLIIDKDGLAIVVGSRTAMEEINRVNTKAGSAVLHYRTSQGLKSLGNQKAVSSSNALFDEAGEKALAAAEEDPHAGIWLLNVKRGPTTHKAAVAKIPATGWLLITVDAD